MDLPTPQLEETMFDSGAARDLIKRSTAKEFPEFIQSMDQVIHLETAAGPETCSEVLQYRNPDAGHEEVFALILKDTPAVLTMGIAVIDKGWHFE